MIPEAYAKTCLDAHPARPRRAAIPRSIPAGGLVAGRDTPPWPEHSGGIERLSGQCFKDAATTDGGGRLPMRPATPVVRSSALAD